MKILIVIGITLLGAIAGQKGKWLRRYLIPSVMASYEAFRAKGRSKYRSIVYLPLMGILSLGYGENSKIRKLCKTDFRTRLFYGGLVAIPFLILGKWLALVLPLVWAIRAGGFKVGSWDWLWEDFFRYLSIGILVII